MKNSILFRKAIFDYLKDTNQTQMSFCKANGIIPSTLSNILSGKTKKIKDETLAKLLPKVEKYIQETDERLEEISEDNEVLSVFGNLKQEEKIFVLDFILSRIDPEKMLHYLSLFFEELERKDQKMLEFVVFDMLKTRFDKKLSNLKGEDIDAGEAEDLKQKFVSALKTKK